MDLPQDCDSVSKLCCDQCHLSKFSSKFEYNLHYLAHKSVSTVSLVKLSEFSVEKLKHQSYKVNNGVARRTRNLVSPLRISLKKQEGSIEFQVVKVQKHDRRSDRGHHGHRERHGRRSHRGHRGHRGHHGHHGHHGESRKAIAYVDNTDSGVTSDTNTSKRDAEGKKSRERHATNSSVGRRSNAYHLRQEKQRGRGKEKEKEKEEEKEKGEEVEQEKDEEGEQEKDEEVEQEKDEEVEQEKDEEVEQEVDEEEEEEKDEEGDKEVDANVNSNKSKSCGLVQDRAVGHRVSGGVSVIKQNPSVLKSESSKEGKTSPKILNAFSTVAEDANQLENSSTVATAESDKQTLSQSTILKKLSGLGFSLIPQTTNGPDVKEQSTTNDSGEGENKRQRVNPLKRSDVDVFVSGENHSEDASNNENSKDPESDALYVGEIPNKENSADNLPAVEKRQLNLIPNGSGPQFGYKDDDTPVPANQVLARGPNSSRRDDDPGDGNGNGEADPVKVRKSDVSKNIKSACEAANGSAEGGEEKPTNGDAPNSNDITFGASTLEPTASPLTGSELQFNSLERQNIRVQDPNECSMLLSSLQNGGDCNGSTFNNVNCGDVFHSDSFEEGNNEAEIQGDEIAVSYSSLPSVGSSIDEPQQDPLMSNEPLSNSGEALSQSFLRSYLNESQTSQGNIQHDNSEYMSLERLAQVSGLDSQHGQGYDVNTGDPTTPMEQLSQQVQRLPNPPINVIPHHHLQAQPPQLHAGLSSLASQQTGSFDALGHMQTALPPPPLYQGFNIFSQNFSSQGSQQLPHRPPMLQQRPQMQRGFQSVSSFPRIRSRYGVKRSPARLPSPQEIPQKQRRIEPAMPERNQTTVSSTTKIPSGITVTPTKKNIEASKVANVLASRGITVTPSSGVPRQGSPGNRSQQRVNPVVNVGQGVSITANTNNRSGGNFVVPSPKRSSPIVNPDIERPERCTTVDLTLDDEPPPLQTNRSSGYRNACNQCSKMFPTVTALEVHKSTHRASIPLPYKCDKCAATYPNLGGLQQHRALFHKPKPPVPAPAPELAIPIVDLNHPGVREQLAKCGINGFLPLSQLQSNNIGQFGLPIMHLDSAKEKALPNLNIFGTANVLVLGKMKQLSQTQIR